ncbi:hypothetical protein IAD21_02301 [Abditibacteriota bacterium]|nr:hypothetical protein IAD21_02301 [Abditibacteriota bacterium]
MCQTFLLLAFQTLLDSLVMNRFLFACAVGLCALPCLAPSAAHAATVSLSVADARLVEPPSGQKSMIFPVTLSGTWPEDVRVTYTTSVGPNAGSADSTTLAQPGFDFSSRQGQITIPAGNTRGQIEVPVLADGEVEKDETFSVTLSNLQGYNNSGATVVLNRSVAKGTIVEPVKGVVLGGTVASYNVSPSTFTYDPTTGQYSDKFDMPAQQVLQSGVSVLVTGSNFSRSATTDSQGRFTVLVRPGSYSVQIGDFLVQDYNGTYQTYSAPARTVSLSRDSLNNSFFFYGVAGTVGIPSSSNSSRLTGAYVKVEARPAGADPTSDPIASAIANYSDTNKLSRGYRFFIPALPPGRYTLTIAPVDDFTYYTDYFDFPTITVTVPVSTGVNRPDAHVAFVGTPKATSNSTRSSKSSSASGS